MKESNLLHGDFEATKRHAAYTVGAKSIGVDIGIGVEMGKLKSAVTSIPIPIPTPIMLFRQL